jgi:hypothetical protein
MKLILGLFALLIIAGLIGGYQYVHGQYYVGTDAGKVVIFRGINENLLGISLSSVYQRTTIPMSGLPHNDAQAIGRADSVSLPGAQQSVAAFRKDYDACQAGYAALRQWVAHKPKPVVKHRLQNGKLKTYTVTPHYRPKPSIPAGCPLQSVPGA